MNLRYWRRRRGLSQAALCRRIGKPESRSWLTRIENAESPQLNPLLLYRYTEALEVPFPFLFRADAGDPLLAEITDNLPNLSPHNRRVLVEVLQQLSSTVPGHT